MTPPSTTSKSALPPPSEKARRLRILLLEPLYPPEIAWGSLKVEQGFLPPIGLLSIRRFLKVRGYNVDFVDTQFGDHDEASLTELLCAGRYDVVGIPVFTSTADHCFWTAKLVRRVLPGSTIVFGHVHASSQPRLTLAQCPEADYIVRREGELTFDELLHFVAEGAPAPEGIRGLAFMRGSAYVETPDRPFIEDLDSLPKGLFGDLDLTRYVPHPTQYVVLPNYPLVTQRGCPYPCAFCQASVILGKKTRYFSPERIIEELKILRDEKGARGVYFQDSTFTMHKKYVMRLLELMVREDLGLLWTCNTRADRIDDELCGAMRSAGCRQVNLGIESGNQQSLDLIRKQTTPELQRRQVELLHRHRISTICNYILCLPNETEEMALNTIRYAKSLASRIAMFYLPVPFPGTELYRACEKSGGLRKTERWSDYLMIDFDDPVYVNPLIGKRRMGEIYRKAFRSYYSDPRAWASHIRSLFWGMPLGPSLRGAKAVLSLMGQGLRRAARAPIPRQDP